MRSASYIKQTPQAISSPPARATSIEQLDNARRRVQAAIRAAGAEIPSYHTLDDIARNLTEVLRELDALAITVAVLSRKENRS